MTHVFFLDFYNALCLTKLWRWRGSDLWWTFVPWILLIWEICHCTTWWF